jgi:hypothetical protein
MSFVDGPFAWRFPIACQTIFAFVIIILIFGLPETPRWLIQQGRVDEAVEVMSKVFDAPNTDAFIVAEKEAMLNAVAIENSSPSCGPKSSTAIHYKLAGGCYWHVLCYL